MEEQMKSPMLLAAEEIDAILKKYNVTLIVIPSFTFKVIEKQKEEGVEDASNS